MNRVSRTLLLLMGLAALPSASGAQQAPPLVDEALVKAPLAQVWNAFTTNAGLESWMTAHAEVDLRIGGTMKSNYDPAGTVDDPKAIVNTILSYEPMRMLSFGVQRAPKGFPFPSAITRMWTVVYFEAAGDNATRVRSVSQGFGTDPESTQMREFFKQGNAATLRALQDHFASAGGSAR
jgi:uncharacterized protein YndB with AHSA1/START domain